MINFEKFSEISFFNKKVAVVSHNDLDGAGPILIMDQLPVKDYKYFTVANASVDKMVKLVLFSPDFEDRDVIFITDCSITDMNLANKISEINAEGKKQIFLFDHHTTAEWLNRYTWAHVTNEEGVSGTKLFFRFMKSFINWSLSDGEIRFLENLSNCISDWDTWQWIKKEGYILPKQMSNLFSRTGIEYFLTKFRNSYHMITDFDTALLAGFERKDKFINIPSIKKTAQIVQIPFTVPDSGVYNYTVPVKCVCVAEAPNDLAELLYEDGIDYVIMFYSNGTVSARSRIDDIHLGKWARYMSGPKGSGGGHVRSAGFTLNANNLWIYEKYLAVRYKGVEENGDRNF
jgi:Predicted phosphohydrolase (DHH superfamily)